jgi:hypothetical protein
MAFVQVQEHDVPVAGKAIVARDFVYVDWSKVDDSLEQAFAFLSSLRLERVQLWATDQVPLNDSAIVAKPNAPGLTPIQGAITGFEALDANGNATSWDKANQVAFTINATATVTFPKTAIAAAAAGVNPLAGLFVGGLLAGLGSNVMVNVGHTSVTVPITRDPRTNGVVEIGNCRRPA